MVVVICGGLTRDGSGGKIGWSGVSRPRFAESSREGGNNGYDGCCGVAPQDHEWEKWMNLRNLALNVLSRGIYWRVCLEWVGVRRCQW